MSTRRRTLIACACCGKPGGLAARGLIHSCYKRHQAAGTLDQFQPLGNKGGRPEGLGPDEAAVPLAVLGALLIGAPTELEEWAEQQLGSDLVTLAVNAAENAELAVSA